MEFGGPIEIQKNMYTNNMMTLEPGAIPGKVSLGRDSFISVLPYVPGGKSVYAQPEKKGK
jgi:hypothetical protein